MSTSEDHDPGETNHALIKAATRPQREIFVSTKDMRQPIEEQNAILSARLADLYDKAGSRVAGGTPCHKRVSSALYDSLFNRFNQ